MQFSKRLPLPAIIDLCRVLRHSLGAGLSLVNIFRQQARSGPEGLRPLAALIHHELEDGESLECALYGHEDAFPPLFVALITVGEQTGTLPEAAGELERYFQMQNKLYRQFVSQASKPALQLGIAIVIITLLIWVLGIIGKSPGMPGLDLLGLGLTGGWGALLFLFLAVGFVAGLIALVIGVWRGSRQTDFALFLLRVPLIGPCLRALALAHFSLALRLTMGSALPIDKAAGLSLLATGNPAFVSTAASVQKRLRDGQDLTSTLARTGLFPDDFKNALEVAEESGQLAETLRRQSDHYHEEAEHRLTMLTRAAAFLVWLLMAVVVIVAIFRIFINVYLAPLGEF